MATTNEAIGRGKPSAYARSLRNFATYKYAREFHISAIKTGSPIVQAYLLGHALELYLKSFLLKAGLTTTLLSSKTYGHNLDKLLVEAKSKNLEKLVRVSPQMTEDLLKLNVLYPNTLRYFSLFQLFTSPTIPSRARLFRLADALSRKLEKHVAIKP